jgi:phage gp45-like
MNNCYTRLASIVKLEYVNQYGRIRVQFQDPNCANIEEGVLIYLTGDNACPAIGDQCIVLGMGDEYGLNYVMPYDIDNAPLINKGEKIIYGANGNKVYLKADGSILIEAADSKNITITTPEASFSQDVNLAGVLKVADIQVVGSQQGAIASPTGGATIDAEARTAIIAILTAIQTHGLIA